VTSRWQDVGEKGGAAGIAFLVVVATALGRRAASAFLGPIAWWFVLLHPDVRRASRDYLARVRPGPVGLREIHRHVRTFAQVALDRLFLARGDLRPFRVASSGHENLEALRARGQGAILLLSHLGSYDAMRTWSASRGLRVSAIGDFRNARMITEALRRINPAVDQDLIQIEDGPGFVLAVEERVSRGGVVATMGDRVGADGKRVEATFLGGRASFPAGPYLLAAVLGCPIYLAFGIHREPDRYEVLCEPFVERVTLPRGAREDALATLAQAYASRLEELCRAAPYNWFNFFDFWSETR
jgi:predicted LPLAT superfamily acyltransferase